MAKIKVLLADDSGFMRMVLGQMVAENPDFDYLDSATDGLEAAEKTLALKPDVLLLDLTMETYDGLYALQRIMQERPTPVIVVSGAGYSNSETVIAALDAGAYDYIPKPDSARHSRIREIKDRLFRKIYLAARVDTTSLGQPQGPANTQAHTFEGTLPFWIIAIGASTGGTGALETLVNNLPNNLPVPVLLVQHMPQDFLETFARRLNQLAPLPVSMAQNNEQIRPNRIYLAPATHNLSLKGKPSNARLVYTTQEQPEYNFPSVNSVLLGVAAVYGAQAIGVVLTGMGQDGARGLEAIHHAGGFTIAQDEKTSVVYGMPKACIERFPVRQVLPLREIAPFLVGALA